VLLDPRLSLASLLESESGFEIVKEVTDAEKRPYSHPSLGLGIERSKIIFFYPLCNYFIIPLLS
jgi:hypothetical protein